MPRTERFSERIGAIFLPEADVMVMEDYTLNPEDPFPVPGLSIPVPEERPRIPWPTEPVDPFWRFKLCYTSLKAGCYTIGFVPSGTPILGTRYRGTLRVEQITTGLRISGDLYSYRLLDDLVLKRPAVQLSALAYARGAFPSDEAADTGGVIPIYPRRKYRSYLKGTRARLFSLVPRGTECTFQLEFDEYYYTHPATGFSGSFNTTPDRQIRWVMRETTTPDLYTGEAFEGSTKLGTVSMRWVSSVYRRAHLQLNTLEGAVSPPASVGGTTFVTIFNDAGWDLTFTDGGAVPLPAALAGIDINSCWSFSDYHTLMTSVPGYNAADLDAVWRAHLVAVPAAMGCSRGWMFDWSGGSDPNAVRREGAATHSHDGYPAGDVPDGTGGSHYDGAADQQQRNVPRAFLRSATHEVGHAFNQIHQQFEGGNDNSIMTPTPGVATFLGIPGTFPDDINLAFNETVKKHLRHLPDPAVRPGAMDFFGSAIAAPEPADVAWLDALEVGVTVSADRVSLGEPVDLSFVLTNRGAASVPAPTTLDIESLLVRVSVTDPTGRITFMRPEQILSCPRITVGELEPGGSITGSTRLFWGRDGFAFETPGRHLVEVIVLWDIAGVPVAAAGEREVFVNYPTSDTDNQVAALMLDPDVGKAVALGEAIRFERAAERIRQAAATAPDHPASEALRRLGLLPPPSGSDRRRRPR